MSQFQYRPQKVTDYQANKISACRILNDICPLGKKRFWFCQCLKELSYLEILIIFYKQSLLGIPVWFTNNDAVVGRIQLNSYIEYSQLNAKPTFQLSRTHTTTYILTIKCTFAVPEVFPVLMSLLLPNKELGPAFEVLLPKSFTEKGCKGPKGNFLDEQNALEMILGCFLDSCFP